MGKVCFDEATKDSQTREKTSKIKKGGFFSHTKNGADKKTMSAETFSCFELLNFKLHDSLIEGNCSNKIIVPLFQRRFCWSEDLWHVFWEDLLYSCSSDYPHSLGRIVLLREQDKDIHLSTSQINHYICIDGQQRISTIVALLCVIDSLLLHLNSDLAFELKGRIKSSIFYKEIDDVKAITSNNIGEFCRFNPTHFDKDTFALLLQKENITSLCTPYSRAVSYFQKKCQEVINEDEAKLITIGNTLLDKFEFVVMLLQQPKASLQTFETMARQQKFANNFYGLVSIRKGKEISSVDLIRNFLLSEIKEENRLFVYENYWIPFEKRIISNQSNEDVTDEQILKILDGEKSDEILNNWMTTFVNNKWFTNEMEIFFTAIDKLDICVTYVRFIAGFNFRESNAGTCSEISSLSQAESRICNYISQFN